MKPQRFASVWLSLVFLALCLVPVRAQNGTALTHQIYIPLTSHAQGDDASPPASPVKLIFIHHSTGENWLRDGYGNLGRELAANNYFVSDTNYGWGPDGIGDRTDIPNWREWFVGPNSPTYLQALFNESAQNSDYSRSFGDPGGENQILLFKSCFPNSALAGRPDDPPDPNETLTVGHAKYVYNDLLNYFVTRPDKLFIVITAPPLQDPEYAANARAFNNWLVFNWLAENNYPHNNVAVFDFYNVLTHPDNHHRVNNGQVEHVIDRDTHTLYYDSDGDDHPNQAGSQKATQEFIPWLNLHYQRWLASAPAALPDPTSELPAAEAVATPPAGDAPPIAPPPLTAIDDLIDDFEGGIPAGTHGWEAFWDEAAVTQISCNFDQDKAIGREQSLRIDFDIAPNSWGACTLLFDSYQDWSHSQGLTFFYHASAPALLFAVTVHSGAPYELTSYQFTVETVPDSTANWIPFELTWEQILGAGWESDAGNPVDPSRVTGVAFSFGTSPDTPNAGSLWIDSLRLLNGMPFLETQPAQQEVPPSALEEESPHTDQGGGLCLGSALPAVFGLVGFLNRKCIKLRARCA